MIFRFDIGLFPSILAGDSRVIGFDRVEFLAFLITRGAPVRPVSVNNP